MVPVQLAVGAHLPLPPVEQRQRFWSWRSSSSTAHSLAMLSASKPHAYVPAACATLLATATRQNLTKHAIPLQVRDLAKALGIDPARRQRGQGVCPYPDHLLLFAATNPIVAGRVERRMLEVARDPHKDGVNLPPMPAAQRAFVHDLAQVYHLRSASYDPEPKRYTRVSRPDSAEQQPGAPTMTLKQAVAKFGTSASAGVGPQR